MKYTFTIYTAKEMSCYDSKYYVVCEETQHYMNADTKHEAKQIIKDAEYYDFGQ